MDTTYNYPVVFLHKLRQSYNDIALRCVLLNFSNTLNERLCHEINSTGLTSSVPRFRMIEPHSQVLSTFTSGEGNAL